MKISQLYILLLLFSVSSIGCERENFGAFLTNEDFEIYIPTVFTINPESVENNKFFINAVSEDPDFEFMVVLMEIHDRYGNPVFKTELVPPNDPAHGWDGRADGVFVESGTYAYSIRIGDETGSLLFVGDLTVLN